MSHLQDEVFTCLAEGFDLLLLFDHGGTVMRVDDAIARLVRQSSSRSRKTSLSTLPGQSGEHTLCDDILLCRHWIGFAS